MKKKGLMTISDDYRPKLILNFNLTNNLAIHFYKLSLEYKKENPK